MRTVSFLGFTTTMGEMVFLMPLKDISTYMRNGYTHVIQKRATEGKVLLKPRSSFQRSGIQ